MTTKYRAVQLNRVPRKTLCGIGFWLSEDVIASAPCNGAGASQPAYPDSVFQPLSLS
jgi:hypothetical protein